MGGHLTVERGGGRIAWKMGESVALQVDVVFLHLTAGQCCNDLASG